MTYKQLRARPAHRADNDAEPLKPVVKNFFAVLP